jgi:lipopolysaccharide transport system permease protein
MALEQTLALPLAESARPVRRIQRSKGLRGPNFRELWHHKELLYYLLWRDVKARYKQTFLGAFWAVFRPLTQVATMTVIFGHVAKISTGSDLPKPLFYLGGLLVWTYFSSTVTSGASCMLSSGGLMSKAYFPRLYIPIASVMAPLIDFGLTFCVALASMAWFGYWPTWRFVFLPLFLLVTLLTGLGISFWLAPIAVRYRDVSFILPFIIQTALYATPIIYPSSSVPERWRWLIDLNPMTSAVEGFRWSLFGTGSPPSLTALASSLTLMTVLVVTGVFNYQRAQRNFVDVL